MLSPRDRLLAALFALQLGAALIFGIVLVHGLDRAGSGQQLLAVGGQAGTPDGGTAPLAGASSAPGAAAAGSAGSKGTASQTVTRGGTPGSNAGAAAAAGKPLAAGAPIKIGAVVTQTGAINFAASAQATKAYVDMVNAKGGVNGHKIILDLRDDQLDATRGRAQAQQLIAEGVFALVGFNAPLTENSIVPLIEQNKIPLVGTYGEQEEYHSAYAYAFSASYGHYGYEMGKYLGGLGIKHPGVIFIDNGSKKANDGLTAGFKAGFQAAGKSLNSGDVVITDPTKASYDDVVTQFRLGGVDGIATVVDQTAYNRLQQSMDRQNYHPKHVADPVFVDHSVKQGPTTEGTYVATDLDFVGVGNDAVQEYVSTVQHEFGSRAQINYIGEQGWLDAKIFVDAISKLGNDISRPRLMQVLDSLKGSDGYGFTAPLHFSAGAHDINHCLKFGKVTNGKVVQTQGWSCDSQPF